MIQRAPIFSRSLHSSNFIEAGISILFLSSGRRGIFSFASQDERAAKEGDPGWELGGYLRKIQFSISLKVHLYFGLIFGCFRGSQMVEREGN